MFHEVLGQLPAGQTAYMGLDLAELIAHAEGIGPPRLDEGARLLPVVVVFPFSLLE